MSLGPSEVAPIDPRVESLVAGLLQGSRAIEPDGAEDAYIRLAVYLNDFSSWLYDEQPAAAFQLLRTGNLLVRQFESLWLTDSPGFRSLRLVLRILQDSQEPFRGSGAGWLAETISASAQNVPTMIYPETCQYYKWLGRQYLGLGIAIELGPWLGGSTRCLLEGLRESPNFVGAAKLHVFDAFIWQDWMNSYAEDVGIPLGTYKANDSFREEFSRNLGTDISHAEIHECWISPSQLNAHGLEQLKCEPIELLVNDFSDELWVTRRVWAAFETRFIPGRTVLVFNQYGNRGASSLRAYIRAKLRMGELIPLHKPFGSAKGFLYLGGRRSARPTTP